jgi:cyclophilin family peptidyl-prolyl cis-trans isomerase/HEAT repeat protein
MSKPKFLFFILTTVLLVKCVPPSEEGLTDVYIDFTDPRIQQLYDLQDRGATDSLYRYFHHKDATYRYLSTLAFASIKDSSAIDSLVPMLYDPIDPVRVMAAYALGQIGQPAAEEPLLSAFDRTDTSGVSRYFNSAILEAVGKCGNDNLVEKLATISTYTLKDTVLLEGQAWGLYRYGLRNKTAPEGTAKMLEFATDLRYPPIVRLIGANYLMRVKDLDLSEDDDVIAPALAREDDPRVRMALVIALGKTETERAANTLLYQYNIERDDRVKINILRALVNFDYAKVKPIVLQALDDPNVSVAQIAADFFVKNGIPEEATVYWQLAKTPGRPWQVGTALYGAALKYLPLSFEESRRYLNWELRRLYENSANPYEKAAALKAMAQYGWNYRYIRDAAYPSELEPVRTASVEALAEIARMPDFKNFFGGGRRAKIELSDCFRDAIENGDVGMMAVAAEVLRDPKLKFEETFDSLALLESALEKLRLPQEIEAYNEVKKALDYFQGKQPEPLKRPRFTHKIPWKLIADLKEETRAVIKTSKGNITLKLMPVVAPGTVANFVELINDGYYKGKNFHRVAPNFVIQGGCSRGDGYSSLNYAIRSELPYLHYDEGGYVGMASAGNHTESNQFFITHSPALHLDGNYTIFAKVESGMEVVQEIQVGDAINEVTLVEKK